MPCEMCMDGVWLLICQSKNKRIKFYLSIIHFLMITIYHELPHHVEKYVTKYVVMYIYLP